MNNRAEKIALRFMSEKANRVFDVLQREETEGFVALPELCSSLELDQLTFFTFSCLAACRGKQGLKLDLFETFFFRKFFKRAKKLMSEIEAAGASARLVAILPDTEPIRTWGWNEVSQEDVTGYCQMMAEDGSSQIPSSWSVILWSELERQLPQTYAQSLVHMREHVHPLLLRDEVDHIRNFSKNFPEITTRGSAEEVAIRQIAAYAFEGMGIEQLFPGAILLQSEFPARRKDKMYAPLRSTSLPIAHPFEVD